jgi:hypothetical protein
MSSSVQTAPMGNLQATSHPDARDVKAVSSGWWVALLGPVCIGLTVAAVSIISAMSF